MKHGDAERMYDFMVLLGLDPVPWQYDFLAKWKQREMDEKFCEILRRAAQDKS